MFPTSADAAASFDQAAPFQRKSAALPFSAPVAAQTSFGAEPQMAIPRMGAEPGVAPMFTAVQAFPL